MKQKNWNEPGKYQCGSCEQMFDKPTDGSCPNCGSGNFIEGYIDEPTKPAPVQPKEGFTPGDKSYPAIEVGQGIVWVAQNAVPTTTCQIQ